MTTRRESTKKSQPPRRPPPGRTNPDPPPAPRGGGGPPRGSPRQRRDDRVLAARAGDEGAQLRIAERHGDTEEGADGDRQGGGGAERSEQVRDDHEERGGRGHAGKG